MPVGRRLYYVRSPRTSARLLFVHLVEDRHRRITGMSCRCCSLEADERRTKRCAPGRRHGFPGAESMHPTSDETPDPQPESYTNVAVFHTLKSRSHLLTALWVEPHCTHKSTIIKPFDLSHISVLSLHGRNPHN